MRLPTGQKDRWSDRQWVGVCVCVGLSVVRMYGGGRATLRPPPAYAWESRNNAPPSQSLLKLLGLSQQSRGPTSSFSSPLLSTIVRAPWVFGMVLFGVAQASMLSYLLSTTSSGCVCMAWPLQTHDAYLPARDVGALHGGLAVHGAPDPHRPRHARGRGLRLSVSVCAYVCVRERIRMGREVVAWRASMHACTHLLPCAVQVLALPDDLVVELGAGALL